MARVEVGSRLSTHFPPASEAIGPVGRLLVAEAEGPRCRPLWLLLWYTLSVWYSADARASKLGRCCAWLRSRLAACELVVATSRLLEDVVY